MIVILILFQLFTFSFCKTKLVSRRPISQYLFDKIVNKAVSEDVFKFNEKYNIGNKLISKKFNTSSTNDGMRVISISPAGLKGFYSFGVALYIKENYELDDVIFSGASAGSWVSLYMAHKGDPYDIPLKVIDLNYEKISSVFELQVNMKNLFLESFSVLDFDMSKVYVGVTGLHNFQLVSNIYSNFDSLLDSLDACIASSHIPLISGGLLTKYNNIISFDGAYHNTLMQTFPSLFYI